MAEYGAKTTYQNKDEALKYDEERFNSCKGKIIDILEKRSIIKILKKYCPNGHVLDIPCGTGRITESLLSHGYYITCADISEKMLMQAKKNKKIAEKCNLIKADAESLEIETDYFDIVVCIRLMGHLPDRIKIRVIKELLRVSKKGAIVTIYVDNPFVKLKRLLKKIVTNNNPEWYPVKFKSFLRFLDIEGIKTVEYRYILPVYLEGVTLYLKKYR